jgi:hypothetical protein
VPRGWPALSPGRAHHRRLAGFAAGSLREQLHFFAIIYYF